MCFKFEIRKVNFIGLVSVSVYFFFGFGALTMSGITFTTMYTDWAEIPIKHLGPINLAVTIYLIICSCFGFAVFSACSRTKWFIILVNKII